MSATTAPVLGSSPMDHPDKAAERSVSPAGEIQETPDSVTSFVVEDEDDNPVGVVEKWHGAAWIYAETDVLRNTN